MPRILNEDILPFNGYPVSNVSEAVIPKEEKIVTVSRPIRESFSLIGKRYIRRRPPYSDTWSMGGELRNILEEYETEHCSVIIGEADDGQIEYRLTPNEYTYPKELNIMVSNAISSVKEEYRKNGGRMDERWVRKSSQAYFTSLSDDIGSLISDKCSIVDAVDELTEVVLRYTLGMGIFELLLEDKRIEDVYIDAPCEKNRIHVTVNNINGINSHVRCRTNLIADKKEIRNLINALMKESGLPYCESNPILETNMMKDAARATIVGYPLSPNGDSVSIRKHSDTPWTLTRLISNGTIDARTAGLLSFLVDNRCTFLVCGPRGAGKSSLLSAMMFEFPVEQRILTIEDTMELPGEKMRSMGYKVQSMLIDERLGGDAEQRANEALRVSLRLGESAIVLGEVRGEEAKTLYQSMRTGRAGSSIMGTIHGDSAKSVYDRVVHDLGITSESFQATDILITLGTKKERGTNRQIRKMKEFVSTAVRPGYFYDISNDVGMFKSPVIKRIMDESDMTQDDVSKEIEARARMRSYLADLALKKGEGFYGPEWIVLANDHLSKCIASGITEPEQIMDSFIERFGRFEIE